MSFSNNYNLFDRSLHYLAFLSPIVQKVLCELENDVFDTELSKVDSSNEVFITGLPRAGTTLLLEFLFSTGEFSTYTYRHMPFILAPMLWSKVSSTFQKKATEQERAHGDGMKITVDSPEAFEEVVWLHYLSKEIIHDDRLSPVSTKMISGELCDALRTSARKILALSEQEPADLKSVRYLSKNNANISRIDVLGEIFPSSTVLVLFRHPLAHISSLKAQHDRFLNEHETDSFSRRYMKWIGHYEFGKNIKPIDFDGWMGNLEVPLKIDTAFWVRYWVAAYSFSLNHKSDRVYYFDFDGLLENGIGTLNRLSEVLELRNKNRLVEMASKLRSPTTRPLSIQDCPPDVWDQAEKVYAFLKSMSI